jgi:hypothetical protein
MNDEQKRDLVKSCGLDWHRGYMPLFHGDETNRYAVLIDAVEEAERERCAKAVPGNWIDPLLTGPNKVVPTGIDCEVVERLLLAVRDRIRKGDAA